MDRLKGPVPSLTSGSPRSEPSPLPRSRPWAREPLLLRKQEKGVCGLRLGSQHQNTRRSCGGAEGRARSSAWGGSRALSWGRRKHPSNSATSSGGRRPRPGHVQETKHLHTLHSTAKPSPHTGLSTDALLGNWGKPQGSTSSLQRPWPFLTARLYSAHLCPGPCFPPCKGPWQSTWRPCGHSYR